MLFYICILEVPISIGAVPYALKFRALEPEVIVVCKRNACIVFHHDCFSFMECF